MARMLGKTKRALRYGSRHNPKCYCLYQEGYMDRAAEKREWRAEATAEVWADRWQAFYDDAYRHMAETCDHDESAAAAQQWADLMVPEHANK